MRADGGAAPQRITFAASLSGASTLPVSAGVSLAVQRAGAPGAGAGPTGAPRAGAGRAAGALAFAPASAVLTWAPGEAGVREFTVDVTGGGGGLADGALVATVVNATNADVDAQRASSAATARPAADLVAIFAVRPNQARAPPLRSLMRRFLCKWTHPAPGCVKHATSCKILCLHISTASKPAMPSRCSLLTQARHCLQAPHGAVAMPHKPGHIIQFVKC